MNITPNPTLLKVERGFNTMRLKVALVNIGNVGNGSKYYFSYKKYSKGNFCNVSLRMLE